MCKDAYVADGVLLYKDAQVLFDEKLYRYADMEVLKPSSDIYKT